MASPFAALEFYGIVRQKRTVSFEDTRENMIDRYLDRGTMYVLREINEQSMIQFNDSSDA